MLTYFIEKLTTENDAALEEIQKALENESHQQANQNFFERLAFTPLLKQTDNLGRTLLHYAIQYQCPKIAAFLISQKDIDLNKADISGATPLHLAAEKDELLVMLLLERKVNQTPDNQGRYPLHYAVMANRNDLLFWLYETPAALNVTDEKGLTPLNYALENGNKEIATELLHQGAAIRDEQELKTAIKLEIPIEKIFYGIISGGNITLAKNFLSQHKKLIRNIITAENNICILYAITNGQTEMGEWLLAQGVNLNDFENEDLIQAAREGWIATGEWLKIFENKHRELSAYILENRILGKQLLFAAARQAVIVALKSPIHLLEWLLVHGTEIDVKAALRKAEETNRELELLSLSRQMDLPIPRPKHYTQFFSSIVRNIAERGQIAMIGWLLTKGININAIDILYPLNTILTFSIHKNQSQTAAWLLGHGAALTDEILENLVRLNHLSAIMVLTKYEPAYLSRILLLAAGVYGAFNVIECVLAQGISVLTTDDIRNTALSYAVEKNQILTVKWLLENGPYLAEIIACDKPSEKLNLLKGDLKTAYEEKCISVQDIKNFYRNFFESIDPESIDDEKIEKIHKVFNLFEDNNEDQYALFAMAEFCALNHYFDLAFEYYKKILFSKNIRDIDPRVDETKIELSIESILSSQNIDEPKLSELQKEASFEIGNLFFVGHLFDKSYQPFLDTNQALSKISEQIDVLKKELSDTTNKIKRIEMQIEVLKNPTLKEDDGIELEDEFTSLTVEELENELGNYQDQQAQQKTDLQNLQHDYAVIEKKLFQNWVIQAYLYIHASDDEILLTRFNLIFADKNILEHIDSASVVPWTRESLAAFITYHKDRNILLGNYQTILEQQLFAHRPKSRILQDFCVNHFAFTAGKPKYNLKKLEEILLSYANAYEINPHISQSKFSFNFETVPKTSDFFSQPRLTYEINPHISQKRNSIDHEAVPPTVSDFLSLPRLSIEPIQEIKVNEGGDGISLLSLPGSVELTSSEDDQNSPSETPSVSARPASRGTGR
jgi:ankyrin repeat protein